MGDYLPSIVDKKASSARKKSTSSETLAAGDVHKENSISRNAEIIVSMPTLLSRRPMPRSTVASPSQLCEGVADQIEGPYYFSISDLQYIITLSLLMSCPSYKYLSIPRVIIIL